MNEQVGTEHVTVTVTTFVADFPPAVAVIVDVPADIPVTIPFNTVATNVLELVHVIVPQAIAPPNWSVHVADNVHVAPTCIEVVHPVSVTIFTIGSATVTLQVAVSGVTPTHPSETVNNTGIVPAVLNGTAANV